MKIFQYLFLLALVPVVGQAGEWQQQHFVDPHSQKSTKTYSMSAQNAVGKNVIFSFHCDTVVRTFSKQSGPAYLERQGMYDTFSLKLYFPDTDFNLYEPVSVRVGWQPKWKTFRPKSFMIGLIHGMAGSAAVMLAILPTTPSIFTGILFLILFSVGTMLSMSIMTIILALPFRYNSSERFSNYIISSFGLMSIALGLALGSDIALGTSFTDILWY